MSQEPASPSAPHPHPHPPASDADTLAAARAVQQLLHVMTPAGLPAGELPTLSDIPVLPPLPAAAPPPGAAPVVHAPTTAVPTTAAPPSAASTSAASTSAATTGAATVAPPHVRRFRALCTCCGVTWETEVDLRRHPEQALLCPRCAATIRHQTEGLDDVRPGEPSPLDVDPALLHGAVPLDSLPELPRHGRLPAPGDTGPVLPLPALHTAAAPPEDARDEPALPAQRTARPIPLMAAAVGALLLLALGVGIGVQWGDTARPQAQAPVQAPVQAQAQARPPSPSPSPSLSQSPAASPPPARGATVPLQRAAAQQAPTVTAANTPPPAATSVGLTATSGTRAQRAAPAAPARAPAAAPAPALPRTPPQPCTAAVAAMGLCNAN